MWTIVRILVWLSPVGKMENVSRKWIISLASRFHLPWNKPDKNHFGNTESVNLSASIFGGHLLGSNCVLNEFLF